MSPDSRLIVLALSLLVLSACKKQPTVVVPPPPSNISTPLEFKGLLASGFPEQDVYIQKFNGSNAVERFEVKTTENFELMAFTFQRGVHGSATANPHDYFKTGSNPLGPFDRGVRIGLALQQWESGRGKGTYTVKDGTATLKAEFEDLAWNGTYSLWCGRVSKKKTTEWPCVQAGQPGNPVVTDRRGRADFEVSFPALLDSTTETGSYLSLALHSDGHQEAKTGDFGKNTHVQVIVRIPSPQELKLAY